MTADRPVTDRLEELLAAQRALQRRLGYDFLEMSEEEVIRYVTDTYVAATVELVEVLNETTWKPWVTGSRTVDRDALVGEVVDLLHFAFNFLLCVRPDLTPAELAAHVRERYLAKNDVNRRRQDEGYDGVATKCPHCRRALDDVGVTRILDSLGVAVLCRGCGGRVRTDTPTVNDEYELHRVDGAIARGLPERESKTSRCAYCERVVEGGLTAFIGETCLAPVPARPEMRLPAGALVGYCVDAPAARDHVYVTFTRCPGCGKNLHDRVVHEIAVKGGGWLHRCGHTLTAERRPDGEDLEITVEETVSPADPRS